MTSYLNRGALSQTTGKPRVFEARYAAIRCCRMRSCVLTNRATYVVLRAGRWFEDPDDNRGSHRHQPRFHSFCRRSRMESVWKWTDDNFGTWNGCQHFELMRQHPRLSTQENICLILRVEVHKNRLPWPNRLLQAAEFESSFEAITKTLLCIFPVHKLHPTLADRCFPFL